MPSKIRPKPISHRDLLRRLKLFGIIENTKRGKGSETILVSIKNILPNGKYSGPSFPIKIIGLEQNIIKL